MLLSTFLRRLPSRKAKHNQKNYRNTKHTVGNIKGRPVLPGPVNDVNEISDAAIIENSIPEITRNAGSKYPENSVNEFTLDSAEKENSKDYKQRNR